MTVSKEAPKIDLNFDTGEDTFKLLGDPVNRDSLNFSFDTNAVASSSPTAISPTTTSTTTINNNITAADLARLESPAIKNDGRRSTFDPVAIAKQQLQLQNEQEQQLKHNNDANKIQPEEDIRGQNPEVDPLAKNQQQQQQQQDELQQVVSETATPSAVIEDSPLPVDSIQTSQQDASTADAAVSDGSPAHTTDAEAAAPEQAKTATTTTNTSATTGNESTNADDAVVENTKSNVSGEIDTPAATTTTTAVTTATTAAAAAAAAVIEKKLSSEQKVVSNEPAKQPAMSVEKPTTAATKQNPEQESKSCFCF